MSEIFRLHPDISVLVIDDNSPDHTAQKVVNLQRRFANLHLLSRHGARGFAASYKDGFDFALARSYEWILQMDADFSHDPRYIFDMQTVRDRARLVVGSRYVAGGGVRNWPLKRRLLSLGGNFYVKFWLGTTLKDMTGGFNMWHRSLLSSMRYREFRSDGYSFMIEQKYQAVRSKAKIIEVPIIFEDRKAQESKMSASIFREAVMTVPWLRFKSPKIETFPPERPIAVENEERPRQVVGG